MPYSLILFLSCCFLTTFWSFVRVVVFSPSHSPQYRELAKGARAEVDASLTDVDRERAVADASNAAAAVAAAAAHSSGKSSGVPVVAVILLTIVAFVIGRFTISYAMMLDEIEEGGGGASEM